MKMLLTSFGIEDIEPPDGATHFYRMPPVSPRIANNVFVPDYEVLLLCESVMMDESSFDYLMRRTPSPYSQIAEALNSLHREGFLELVDLQGLLKQHRSVLGRMLTNDLAVAEIWVEPLRHSLAIWRGFIERAAGVIAREPHDDMHVFRWQDTWRAALHDARGYGSLAIAQAALLDSALASSRTRRKKDNRVLVREVLSSYLAHVNANLILSSAFNVGFHDWSDFQPFYETKFLSVGREFAPAQPEIRAARLLFDVSFPELQVSTPKGLLRLMTDHRIVQLRELIADAAVGKKSFDTEFAKAIVSDVWRAELKTAYYRRIVSYLTMPLSLVPLMGTLVQKAAEESVDIVLERRIKKEHSWFYMLSTNSERETSE